MAQAAALGMKLKTAKLGKAFQLRQPAEGAPVICQARERWSLKGTLVWKGGKPPKAKAEKGTIQEAGAQAVPAGAPAAAAAGAGGAPAAAAAAGGAAPARQYRPSSLPLEERFQLALSVGQECIQPEELRLLLEKKPFPVCYDGFEPSGRMHIAQGIMKAINVNKLTQAGCVFKFWVADWFAQLNNKMGADMKKIRTVGEYMIEVWRAAGMDMTNVEFLWASEEINRRPDEYWTRVMDIARLNSIARIRRCGAIMGRQGEEGDVPSAQIMYPCMQCADVFFLKADICQLGMDQRKVNMLAREYCDMKKIKFKPVILGHTMLAGLKEGQEKMSKSAPDTAIFMEDSAADVKRKINKAFCPPEQVEGNPCLNWMQHVIFAKYGSVDLERAPEHGGDKTFASFEEMSADYVSGALHPGDVKKVLIKYINLALEPVRQHFQTDKRAADLLKKVRSYRTTR